MVQFPRFPRIKYTIKSDPVKRYRPNSHTFRRNSSIYQLKTTKITINAKTFKQKQEDQASLKLNKKA